MGLITTPYLQLPLTANGGSNGILTVSSTNGLYAGATVYLNGTSLATYTVVIASIVSSTQIAVYDPSIIGGAYSYYNASAYTTAASSSVTQPIQSIFNESPSTTAGVNVAYGSLIANGGNGSTVAIYTPTTTGVFEVGGYYICTTFASGNVGISVNYTDTHAGLQSYLLWGTSGPIGANLNVLSATGQLNVWSQTIAVSSATSIIIKTFNSGANTADYYGWIRQIA